MEPANTASIHRDSSGTGLPARRDWLDFTVHLATSWVGLFAAYFIALLLAFTKFNELKKGLFDMGLTPWGGIALVTVLPLLALVFSTIPTFIEQRRIKRYSEISGSIQPGYFTLQPREDEDSFERADDAQKDVQRWIETAKEPVLYLTGPSGTGKSSLLSAWVVPKLRRQKHVVIRLRGYEHDLLSRIREALLQPGLIWDRAPGGTSDLRSLLNRAIQRLGDRRLFVIIDQFEEFLIFKDEARQSDFQQLVEGSNKGVTFLLVYRPEYEGLMQDRPWPKLQIHTNRRLISPFTENAGQEFLRKSGLVVNTDLMRAVLREAAEIEQTVGLIRPVTLNLCGLVLGRFYNGLPRRLKGGLILAFLRESLQLPEVRDVAGKLIPQLITDNIAKRPRTITDMAKEAAVGTSTVRACLRRLGESDRAIVRPLDKEQETWEISHDFLVPLLDSLVIGRTVSLWRTFRPWLPWTTTAVMGIAAVVAPLMMRKDPTVQLRKQGWVIAENQGVLTLNYEGPIPRSSISVLRNLPQPFAIHLSDTDLSTLPELNNVTDLSIDGSSDLNLSGLRRVRNLKRLVVSNANVTNVSDLAEVTGLKELYLYSDPKLSDISSIQKLPNLTTLALSKTRVTDLSPVRKLKNLTTLLLNHTGVKDISALGALNSLKWLDLDETGVSDISPLQELKNLTQLELRSTAVADVSALRDLKKLRELDLTESKVTDAAVSSLKRALPNVAITVGPYGQLIRR